MADLIACVVGIGFAFYLQNYLALPGALCRIGIVGGLASFMIRGRLWACWILGFLFFITAAILMVLGCFSFGSRIGVFDPSPLLIAIASYELVAGVLVIMSGAKQRAT